MQCKDILGHLGQKRVGREHTLHSRVVDEAREKPFCLLVLDRPLEADDALASLVDHRARAKHEPVECQKGEDHHAATRGAEDGIERLQHARPRKS